MHFDGRRLRYSQQWERIEIGLRDAAIFDGDLLMQSFGESVKDGTLRHVHRSGRVDDMIADVPHGPHLVDLHRAVRGYRRFHDLGEISKMAVIDSNALPDP